MKIVCYKDQILKALNSVVKGVASKTTMPILEGILIQTNDKGETIYSVKAGDLKKAHYHLLIEYRNTTTANNISHIIECLNTKIFEPCLRVDRQYSYFWHDPEYWESDIDKAIYNPEDIIEGNGFDHMKFFEFDSVARERIYWQLMEIIQELNIKNLISLMLCETLTREQRVFISLYSESKIFVFCG